MNHRNIDFLFQALTQNRLSADEFQPLFVKLSHEERMALLDRLEREVAEPAVPPPTSLPPQLYRPRAGARSGY